jgi:hypothetical protein
VTLYDDEVNLRKSCKLAEISHSQLFSRVTCLDLIGPIQGSLSMMSSAVSDKDIN